MRTILMFIDAINCQHHTQTCFLAINKIISNIINLYYNTPNNQLSTFCQQIVDNLLSNVDHKMWQNCRQKRGESLRRLSHFCKQICDNLFTSFVTLCCHWFVTILSSVFVTFLSLFFVTFLSPQFVMFLSLFIMRFNWRIFQASLLCFGLDCHK